MGLSQFTFRLLMLGFGIIGFGARKYGRLGPYLSWVPLRYCCNWKLEKACGWPVCFWKCSLFSACLRSLSFRANSSWREGGRVDSTAGSSSSNPSGKTACVAACQIVQGGSWPQAPRRKGEGSGWTALDPAHLVPLANTCSAA